MVLRRGADQRRAADIDVLDALFAASTGSHGYGKWVEVRDQKIDFADPVLRQRGEVIGAVAARQQPAMDRGMQRLDPAVEHLGKPGELSDLGNRKPGLLQRTG